MVFLKKIILDNIPKKFLEKLSRKYVKTVNGRISFAQDGEDVVLKSLIDIDPLYQPNFRNGFFVDIGAHHPIWLSNTFYFYSQLGWSGINIDAAPDSKKEFEKVRPRDLTLEIGVSGKDEFISFFIFDKPEYNTFSETVAIKVISECRAQLVDKCQIETMTLGHILDKHLPSGKRIDFLTIDVEGLDLEVLLSNNWIKYRPRYILAELVTEKIDQLMTNELFEYLTSLNYDCVSATHRTKIFKSQF